MYLLNYIYFSISILKLKIASLIPLFHYFFTMFTISIHIIFTKILYCMCHLIYHFELHLSAIAFIGLGIIMLLKSLM